MANCTHGHNLFLYHHARHRNEARTVDFGVVAARPFDREGDVQCFETPAGEVARTVRVGPYDRLSDAHNAIHAWCASNNQNIAQASWETYGDWKNDPELLKLPLSPCLPKIRPPANGTALLNGGFEDGAEQNE